MNKKFFVGILIASLLVLSVFSQETADEVNGYKINEVSYDIDGITKESALDRNVSIDKNFVFNSEEELNAYLSGIIQSIENTRLLDNVSFDVNLISVEDGICLYAVILHAKDSNHLLILPKPGYNSNSGAELKLKLKDTNFLGFFNTLDADLSAAYGTTSRHPDGKVFSFGVGFDYDLPFSIGVLQNTWSNNFDIGYTVGEKAPDLSYTTGLGFGIPLGKSFLNLSASQSVVKSLTYEENGDGLYFSEGFGINYPVVIFKKDNIIPFTWTPSVNYDFSWDIDGLNPMSKGIYKPVLKFGETFAYNEVNWVGNFRSGYSVSSTHSLSMLFDPEMEADIVYVPYFDVDSTYFTSWGWGGFNSHFKAFWETNTSSCIGGSLRGTLDANAYTSSAIILQLDLPFKLFATDFLGMGMEKYGSYENFSGFAKFMSYLDFEMQASPFVDMALVKKDSTNTYFNPKDGFYDVGLEVLVYPRKWKSYVVRVSGGIDFGRKVLKNFINMDGRDSGRSWELFIGLGHNF